MKALSLVTNATFAALCSGAWLRYRMALGQPRGTQECLLRDTLGANRHTRFGERHRFSSITTVERFRQRVPLSTYKDYAEDLSRIRAGEEGVLTAEPVLNLAWSSGSTSAAKLVPYTRTLQHQFQHGIAAWMFELQRRRPALLAGPSYWSITPRPVERELPDSAVPVGFEEDSAYLGGLLAPLVRAAMVVPSGVDGTLSVPDFQRRTLLALLECSELRLISVWHPSFLTLLLEALVDEWDTLLAELRGGSESVRKNPLRASELESLSPTDTTWIWPQLRVVSSWADGNAAPGAAELQRRLPGVELQPKGLLSTEAFVSLPFGGGHPLAIRSHFFEFLPQGGSADRDLLLAHELDPGQEAEVIVTTGGGLYRYRTGDQVRVDGFVGRTPSIRFQGRVDQVSDLTGEKLNDGFVSKALARLFEERGLAPRFALLAPTQTEATPGYDLFLECDGCAYEPLALELESLLRANPHYAWSAELGQLRRVEVVPVRGGARTYVEAQERNGKRLGDVKIPALSTETGWRTAFHLQQAEPARQGGG